ncbi:MAG TPA: sterol desaturase family protein [Bacteroidia bacterium]|jgi:sterol desaturase/sphingolipid hydroxylase (fatty acid hydroxylase superfamily)|nr:sterol desaturase family protein [Bacteroidia bacterium]
MSLHSVEIITTALLIVSAVVIILLERKFPYRKGLPIFRDGFWVDFIWYTLIQSFFLKIVIFDYIIYPIDQHYRFSSFHVVSNWPIILQVLFFLATHDFYIYWFHRWQHNSKILWRTHEAHHSNKEVDWLSGSRSHVLEIIINQTIEFAPIILLGANPIIVPIKALIDAIWGMFIHSNMDVKLGRFKKIINGPAMHLWHHADCKQVFFANFSTKFSFWDWIFGTAYLPDFKPEKYGLYYDYPKDYFVQHIFSVKRVDENKLREKKIFKNYFNLRLVFIQWFKKRISFRHTYRKYKTRLLVYLTENKPY